jgi:hypothetical protein
MEFLISVQTHDGGNNQDNHKPYEGFVFKRYGCNNKTEVNKRCIRSLVKAVNYAKLCLPEVTFKLHVFDDHSSEQCIQNIKDALKQATVETKLVHLDGRGLINSLKECYLDMRDNGKDLVMQVQDDYLFYENCFEQLVKMWSKFQPRFEKPLSLLHWNDPYRYWDENIVPVRIVQGPDRHWRQTYQVPCTFMTHHGVLTKEWDVFEKISQGNPLDPRLEDDSLNRLWQEREYIVMSPIPSLALHFQSDREKDPYIDWEPLWNSFGDQTISNPDIYKTSDKIVLNIGCGKTPLNEFTKCFDGWKEVRIDAFENETADVISSIVDFEGIPDSCADAVWASHVVEHNYWHELPKIFSNMMRVLKDDGFAIVKVPNLATIAGAIHGNILTTIYDTSVGPVTAMDMIYGHRGLVEAMGEGMAHKTGFTKSSMEAVLESLGIKAIVKEMQHDLEVVAFLFKDEPPEVIFDQDLFKV